MLIMPWSFTLGMFYFGLRMSFSHLTFSAADAWRTDNALWQSNPLVNSLLKSCRNALIKSNTESLAVAALDRSVLEQNPSSASVFYGDFPLLKWCPDSASGKHKDPIIEPGIPVGTERQLENTSQEFLLQGLLPKPRWILWGARKISGIDHSGDRAQAEEEQGHGKRMRGNHEQISKKNLIKPPSNSLFPRVLMSVDLFHPFCSEWTILGFFSGCCRASSAQFKAGHYYWILPVEQSCRLLLFWPQENTLAPQNLQPKWCRKYFLGVSVQDFPISQDSKSSGAIS